METPLDVLSRAASLVKNEQKSDFESDESSSLRTPEIRRKRERREKELSFAELSRNPVRTAGTQTSPLSPVPKARVDAGPPPLVSIKQEDMDHMQSVSMSPHNRPSVITSTKVIQHPVGYLPTQMYTSHRTSPPGGIHRREVVESAGVDPFVEEHFRRSLGEDYIHVSPIHKTVAGSVDEHFAKALGETWSQINTGVHTQKKSNSPSAQRMQSLVSPAN
ncbi:transcription cofactor vestigial-like protein 4 [Nematostella vectensis]|uniref:transcription cofactor vestigial-like protein 4 n=1 Tax=Nematostella vectensis TaxID=45351 RepID=UPI0020770FE5|nr:transcription cofactor vestigial-like protein 4 [Nematostella vectensis]